MNSTLVTNPPVSRFSGVEYGRRLGAVRSVMVGEGLAALVVVGAENIHYLTGLDCQGFFAVNALVVPVEGVPLLVTRAMEHPTVVAQTTGCVHLPYTDVERPVDGVVRAVWEASGAGDRVGVEQDLMGLPPAVWEVLRAGFVDRELVDGSGIVARVRLVPSPVEVDCVRAAAATTSVAMAAGIGAVGPGASERGVAAAVYQAMILAGSEYPGFVPLVRTRDRLLQEHVTWGDGVVGVGDAMFLELSGAVGRYHAPMTRMVYVGEPPPGTARAAEIAVAGLYAVRDALVPGTPAAQVYQAWQRVVDEGLGHGNYRRHHCGYLVGLGFPPSWVGGSRVVGLRPGSDLVVVEGMAFHVLSWLLGQYVDGYPADFVVSDTILVTPGGGEILTSAVREPLVAN